MTIGTLIINIGIVALLISVLIKFVFKKDQAIWMTFIQSFCGALFIFSGWVKAVDPLGTAYKMEQYFTEFHYTFDETAMSFIAPMFPFLSEYVVGFSVIMIVLEILLGVALLVGAKPKLTAWLFFGLTVFFTILTGFTFLTGYVPSGTNFFSFGSWGPYSESNMRVTDCGCFGDFIKLKPRVSFFKDIFLLIPAILFLLFQSKMYHLFTAKIRNIVVGGLGFVTLIYCFSNYVWDIPHIDFRPFKEGADIRAQYEAEQDAMGNVSIIAWKIKNISSGEVVELSNDVFMSEWTKKYKKDEWEVLEQVKSEPAIPVTKISDFEFVDSEGHAVSEDLMAEEGVTVLIVSHKLKGKYTPEMVTVKDTTFVMDTVFYEEQDSFVVEQKIEEISEREEQSGTWAWDDCWKRAFTDVVNPFISGAQQKGAKVMAVAGGAGASALRQLEEDINATYSFYEADDILLKTIVRSNPGIVIWKDGKILAKWHYKKLPEFSEVEHMF